MSEENKALVRRVYEAISAGNLEVLRDAISDGFVEHEEFPGLEASSSKEGAVRQFELLRAAFPDFSISLDDMVAEGDKVFIRATMRGTHRGEFMGMPATGKQITVPVGDFIRIVDGKAVEHWGVTDTGAMMQQLD